MVILFDKEYKLLWERGILLELIPSEDGLIRKAKVRTKNTETIRAVNQLYPLEIRVEESIDSYKKLKAKADAFGGFRQSEVVNNKKRLEAWRKATSIPGENTTIT